MKHLKSAYTCQQREHFLAHSKLKVFPWTKKLPHQSLSFAVFTRDMFTWGKCYFTIENVTQYNRNVNLPRVNVSRVNTAFVVRPHSFDILYILYLLINTFWPYILLDVYCDSSNCLKAVYTGDFRGDFCCDFNCAISRRFQSPVWTTGDSNRRGMASSLHGRFKIAAEVAAKIASVNVPLGRRTIAWKMLIIILTNVRRPATPLFLYTSENAINQISLK